MLSSRIESGAIFVGIAKNVCPYISKVLANIAECASAFARTKVIIVENDSTDGTCEILQKWASTDDEHIYIGATDVPSDLLTRTERIAYFRNIYLTEIENEGYNEFEYVVVFDCDNVIASWIDKDAFINAVKFLAKEEQNAAVFANTRGFYYDVWPLRHPIWCPGDCWYDAERLSTITSHTEAVLSCVGARQVRIKSTSKPIPVTSAFGGMAIYKRRYLLGRRYIGRNRNGSATCEHVALHESISSANGKLFIYPELLVRTPYEHIHRARDKLFYRTLIRETLGEWTRKMKLPLSSFRGKSQVMSRSAGD
jgi:glycosyltransferase involved in cell wall biosynthesis